MAKKKSSFSSIDDFNKEDAIEIGQEAVNPVPKKTKEKKVVQKKKNSSSSRYNELKEPMKKYRKKVKPVYIANEDHAKAKDFAKKKGWTLVTLFERVIKKLDDIDFS